MSSAVVWDMLEGTVAPRNETDVMRAVPDAPIKPSPPTILLDRGLFQLLKRVKAGPINGRAEKRGVVNLEAFSVAADEWNVVCRFPWFATKNWMI